MSLTILPLELTRAYNLRINRRMIKKKQRIKDLPSGVGVTTAVNGSGVKYWRIRLGKRFTGGPIVLKDFRNLDDAREWITKQRAQAAATGQASYSLTMAQMADAKTAFDLLKGKTSLATCANYWLKHAAPRGGVKTWKDISSEFLTTRRAMGCKPKTLVQYESYLRVIGEE